MLELGPVSDLGVLFFGRQFYQQNEAVLLSAIVVIFIAILYAIYLKLTYKEHGIRRAWNKPPPHEEHEITRYREKSQNKE